MDLITLAIGGPMAHPEWFQPEHYATQKLNQMDDIKYLGKTGWTLEEYEAQLRDFRDEAGNPIPGDTIEDKAYTNFLACNGANYLPEVPRSALNVSPNQYFDVGVYLQNLADHENRVNQGSAPGGEWTRESMLQHLYNDLRISAWEHYTTVGMFENINPSNAFDANAYMQARVDAMNAYENWNGVLGWQQRTDWTLDQALDLLGKQGLNPIMDLYGTGGKTFGLTASAVQNGTVVPTDWNQWMTPQPANPYDDVKATIEMTGPQTAYTSANGVNTRFEAVWNNATDESTIYTTDTIHAGANAHNTLAVLLDAPWPGFRGQNGANVTNVGQVELTHGEAQPGRPYNFDARNISNLERVEVNDNGAGAISLKNMGVSVKQVNLHNLTPSTGAAEDGETGAAPGVYTQATSIEHAAGAMSGREDALSLGVDNVGANNAPAPVSMNGVENLTVNAINGANVINLQNALGVRNFKVAGGADIKITNVANGILNYDASAASGIVNMAASDLQASTPVQGGSGLTTLTLTQDFNGAPVRWSNIDYLAINPGVAASVQAQNAHGLSGLWINTPREVSLTNLGQINTFRIFEQYSSPNAAAGKITVLGQIKDVVVNTADYAASEGGVARAQVVCDAANNAVVNSQGQGTLSGSQTFTKAAGTAALTVAEEAGYAGTLTAVNAKDFTANIAGYLGNGSKFNVTEHNAGTVTINAANGIAPVREDAPNTSEVTLDSDGAATLNITSGGHFGLSRLSSLQNVQNLNITMDGDDSTFNAEQVSLPNARSIHVNGGDVALGNLGSNQINHAIEIAATCEEFATKAVTTGTNGNIIANITAENGVHMGNLSAGGAGNARGDVHLTVEAASFDAINIAGADIFVNLAALEGNNNVEQTGVASKAQLTAAESINYVGSEGNDALTVAKVGTRSPSYISLGDGSDTLTIDGNAVSAGQRVRMDVSLGEGDDTDVLNINSQTGGKMALYVNDFAENVDVINNFTAASVTQAQAHILLEEFGVVNVPDSQLKLVDFGTARNAGVIYEDDLYAFNNSRTTMVVLTGVNGGVSNLRGIAQQTPDDQGEGEDADA